MRDKRKLTQTLIDQLPEQHRASIDDVYPVWWQNLRSGGGMRLTDRGYDAFCNLLNLERYHFPLIKMNLHTVMLLDQRLQSPYYLILRKRVLQQLVVFGSREAVVIGLCGSVDRYLKQHD